MLSIIANSKVLQAVIAAIAIMTLAIILVMVSGFKLTYINKTRNWRCNNETFIGRFVESVFNWRKRTDQDTSAVDKEDDEQPAPEVEEEKRWPWIDGGADGNPWTPFKDD